MYALATLGQTTNVYFDVVYNGSIIKTATAVAVIGSNIPAVPEELDNGMVHLSQPSGKVTEKNQHVQITATAKTPFEFATAPDLSDAKWYNLTIRGDWFVYADEGYPFYPKQDVSYAERMTDKYLWAFRGNPYSIAVYNREFGYEYTLIAITVIRNDYAEDGVTMHNDDTYVWDALANDDGFILKVPGSEHKCINQYNGGGGPLLLWDDAKALTDDGCTFRIYGSVVIDGIDSVPAASEGEEVIYNLSGQRLSKMQKGINIVDGRKVLVKLM